MNAIRVIVDTNVLISGAFGIKNSPSAYIVHAIRTQQIILVTSPQIIGEIVNVINRERIVKRTKMTIKERGEFIAMLIERSQITEGNQLQRTFNRDIKDDKFLACALEGKIKYIISGDDDLLDLKEYKGIIITTPKEFMETINRFWNRD